MDICGFFLKDKNDANFHGKYELYYLNGEIMNSLHYDTIVRIIQCEGCSEVTVETEKVDWDIENCGKVKEYSFKNWEEALQYAVNFMLEFTKKNKMRILLKGCENHG